MIAIVDYGMGNLGSIRNMLSRIGVESTVTSDPNVICLAEKIILPGVGAFDAGMECINRSGLRAVLDERVLADKVPVLGLCLGMQLMAQQSEEGRLKGLGWIEADVVRFRFASNERKVPHMGWNTVTVVGSDPLAEGVGPESQFYFVHSYFARCRAEESVLFRTYYGEAFASGFVRSNIRGVQFHPEKSHRHGMRLLRSFAKEC